MAWAALTLSLLGAGCAGFGTEGRQAFKDAKYPDAFAHFETDLKNNPNHPLAQFNMADGYQQKGQIPMALQYYRQVAANGKNMKADEYNLLEQHDSNTTLSEVACRYIRQAQQTDPNCN